MILLAPALLFGLLVLPLLWWLLRALPPAPRAQSFPPLRLLLGLSSRLREARRVPPWLLALRLLAVALAVLGLSQPVRLDRDAGDEAAGSGTLLLAIDNGWAASPDWAARLLAADDALDRAARRNRPVSLLLTAPGRTGAPPAPTPPTDAAALRATLDRETPLPWPVDRAAAARAVREARLSGGVLYVADGLAGPSDDAFAAALAGVGPVAELRGAALLALPGRPAVGGDGSLRVKLLLLPAPTPRLIELRGETASGGVLARQPVRVPAGAATAEASLALPSELRNQLSRLVVETGAGVGAAAVRLLDESDHRRPVGLLTQGAAADTPLLGSAFFLRRALAPLVELRGGGLDALLARPLSVLVAPDGTLGDAASRQRVAAWVRGGGTLIRFAGPRLAAETAGRSSDTAAAPAGPNGDPSETAAPTASPADAGAATADRLLPVPLLGGARQLGGAMSWSRPEHPAPFGDDSPFAGLPIPAEVLVSRQVLAQPDASLGEHVWARLDDGTPLVTHAALGAGHLVLFHITSTADWSNLPLSGLFPAMLQRLAAHAAGVETPGDRAWLAPAEILAGDGQLGPPPLAARALRADLFGRTPASATHPAGLYGPPDGRRALNLADALPALAPEQPIGAVRDLSGRRNQHPLGPALLAASLLLLCADLLATLALRGLLRPGLAHRGGSGGVALLMLLPPLLAAWPIAASARAGATAPALLLLAGTGTIASDPAALSRGLASRTITNPAAADAAGNTPAANAGRPDPGTSAPDGNGSAATGPDAAIPPAADPGGTPVPGPDPDAPDAAGPNRDGPNATAPTMPEAAAPGTGGAPAPGAALETRLAYVVTGNADADAISRQGLDGLSRYANARTSAKLGAPDGVVPGRDDLAFYPLLYWPVTPQTVRRAPDPAWQAALNGFMARGGILLIDTQGVADQGGGDNGGGYVPVVPGTARALRLATAGLDIPPLAVLSPNHVLTRSFYLLRGMPGRYAGAPVWAAGTEDAGNDGVSPVIIGANDWAAAWAADPTGGFPYATIPGSEEQRTRAYRFGVNAVIYALTGNYKSDQVHVPALLKRLGQGADGADATGPTTELSPEPSPGPPPRTGGP